MCGLIERFPRPAESVKLVLPACNMAVTGPKFRGSEFKQIKRAEGTLGASELRVCRLTERFPPQTDYLLKLEVPGAILARNGAELREIEL